MTGSSLCCSNSQRGAFVLQLLGLPKDYNQSNIFDGMADSWYCLQPTGDSPTRAQVFDCLAAGALLLDGAVTVVCFDDGRVDFQICMITTAHAVQSFTASRVSAPCVNLSCFLPCVLDPVIASPLTKALCSGAVTIPVFFDKYLIHTMPFADVLPWDEISVTLDFNHIFDGNLNALDELNKQFDVGRALAMARKVRSNQGVPLILTLCFNVDRYRLAKLCSALRTYAAVPVTQGCTAVICVCTHQVHDWRHVFLYSKDPDWTTVRFDEMSVVHPNDDALTSSLKSVMRHVCRTQQLPTERCYPAAGTGSVDIRQRPSAAAVLRDQRRSQATFADTGRAAS